VLVRYGYVEVMEVRVMGIGGVRMWALMPC